MADILQTLTLDVSKEGVQGIVSGLKRGEHDDRKLTINVYNQGAAYDMTGKTAAVRLVKPNGNKYYANCAVENGQISFTIKPAITVYAGEITCEIIISGDGTVLASPAFCLIVSDDILSDEVIIIDTSDYTTLTDAIAAATGNVIVSGSVTNAGVLSFTKQNGGTVPVSGNIKGPQGDKGDKGDTGAKGDKGDTGATGPTGATGAKGDKGDKGDPGDEYLSPGSGEDSIRGAASTAGCLGFRMKTSSVTQSGNNYVWTVEVCDNAGGAVGVTALAVNDEISCKAGYSWNFCGKITGISGQALTVALKSAPPSSSESSWAPADHLWNEQDPNDRGYLWVATKPTAGVVPIGYAAFAVGDENKANEYGAIAAGYGNIADGRYSAAFGALNVTGYCAFAEGMQNKAIELYAHAEGAYNVSSGNCSHAEGRANEATGARSHAEGFQTKAIGSESHAEGRSSRAEGNYSHAEGSAWATGTMAHGEGNGTTASGSYSHAEGGATQATNHGSHAEGKESVASGANSHAEGEPATPSGGTKTVTTASGGAAHAEGGGTTASGSTSHAEGALTVASGDFSHAEGNANTAAGNGSHVEGGINAAHGYYSHVEGSNNTAGYYEVGTGVNTVHIEGYKNTIGGDSATIGSGCQAAHAEGANNVIKTGKRAHVEGEGNTANATCQHVQGQYNIELGSDYVDIVGWGSGKNTQANPNKQKNISVLDKNGNLFLRGDVFVANTSNNCLTGGLRVPRVLTGDQDPPVLSEGDVPTGTLYYKITFSVDDEGDEPTFEVTPSVSTYIWLDYQADPAGYHDWFQLS